MNSFLLCNNRCPLKCSIRCTFSARHSGHKTKDVSARSKYILAPLFVLFSIFGLMLREKGGLNQIILPFHCFLLVLLLVFVFGMKTKGSLNPLFSMLQNVLVLPFEKSLC